VKEENAIFEKIAMDKDNWISKLEEKLARDGENLMVYLEGLYHSRYLTYWDYVQLETLLSLQRPLTTFPDEVIFIAYHQITELFFKLILHEVKQVIANRFQDLSFVKTHLKRIVHYFRHLAHTFDIMVYGMEKEQFLQFRTRLTPASGFQSYQFRLIEFHMTPLLNLVKSELREALAKASPEEQYAHLYWKYSNRDVRTGHKTLTMRLFEEKYDPLFQTEVKRLQGNTVYDLYLSASREVREDISLQTVMKELDLVANIYWRLSHYKAAAHYLYQDPEVIAATGGTNWQEYLPPHHQHILFFPSLWSEEERKDWGRRALYERFEKEIQSQWQNPASS
jgi:tryptophan 2,3-dioxygenase